MTVKEYIRRHGWNLECENIRACRSMEVDIAFENEDTLDDMDETEFIINAYDDDELSELFDEFCKENNLANNTVDNIVVSCCYEEEA